MAILNQGQSLNNVAGKSQQKGLRGNYPMVNPTHPGYCPYSYIHYVDSGLGNDNNSGHTPASALQSLGKAIALVSNIGQPYQCIILMPSQTAYHDDTGETYGYVIPAACDDLTIMSASSVPGSCRHTVIGATDEGATNGIIYSLAENLTLLNLTFLSSKTCVFLGTESTHGTSTNVVTAGAHIKGCVFDTGTTATMPALISSCTNAVIEDCQIISNGATSDAFVAYDPFTLRNSVIQAAVDGVVISGGASYTTRISDCKFECKPDEAALTGYAIYIGAGSNDVMIYDCLFCNGQEGDGTALIGAADGTFTGKANVMSCYYPTDPYTPAAGAGDKTITTTALSVLKAV